MKEIGRFEKILYFLNQCLLSKDCTTQNIAVTLSQNKVATTQELSSLSSLEISLWDKRFGHMSFLVLTKLLPLKVDTISES